MPQTFTALCVHIVFSTKDRRPFLEEKVFRESMHAYFGGACSHLARTPILVGGVEDHVHILARQSKQIAVADWVRDLKSNSSKWAHGLSAAHRQFAWQTGYGAFSVDTGGVEAVRRYIQDQEEHHRRFSFRDEFLRILEEHDITPDETYMWD